MVKTSKRDQRLRRVDLAFNRMLRHMEVSIEDAARRGGVHPTDLRCIAYLLDEDRAVSPKDIIAALHLTSGSGTALFDRLERHGYIRREPNPVDRRGVFIRLDKEAALEPMTLLKRLQGQYRIALEPFSEENLDVIADFLERASVLGEEEGS